MWLEKSHWALTQRRLTRPSSQRPRYQHNMLLIILIMLLVIFDFCSSRCGASFRCRMSNSQGADRCVDRIEERIGEVPDQIPTLLSTHNSLVAVLLNPTRKNRGGIENIVLPKLVDLRGTLACCCLLVVCYTTMTGNHFLSEGKSQIRGICAPLQKIHSSFVE